MVQSRPTHIQRAWDWRGGHVPATCRTRRETVATDSKDAEIGFLKFRYKLPKEEASRLATFVVGRPTSSGRSRTLRARRGSRRRWQHSASARAAVSAELRPRQRDRTRQRCQGRGRVRLSRRIRQPGAAGEIGDDLAVRQQALDSAISAAEDLPKVYNVCGLSPTWLVGRQPLASFLHWSIHFSRSMRSANWPR